MLKDKKIFIFLFLIVFLFIFSIKVNADSNYTDTYIIECFNDAKGRMENGNFSYYDYVIIDDGNNIGIFFFINENYSCYNHFWLGDNNYHLCCNYWKVFEYNNNGLYNTGENNTSTVYDTYPTNNVLYSSFDIKNEDNSDFFLVTLLSRIVPVVNRVEMGGVMKEIIIILPMILVLVVSLVGFRKAWVLLSTILHNS